MSRKCILTGKTEGIHMHHVFFGADRKASDKHGFIVPLHWDRHLAASPYRTPHNDRRTDLMLKRYMQSEYEKKHSRAEFLAIIGRDYLQELTSYSLSELIIDYWSEQ